MSVPEAAKQLEARADENANEGERETAASFYSKAAAAYVYVKEDEKARLAKKKEAQQYEALAIDLVAKGNHSNAAARYYEAATAYAAAREGEKIRSMKQAEAEQRQAITNHHASQRGAPSGGNASEQTLAAGQAMEDSKNGETGKGCQVSATRQTVSDFEKNASTCQAEGSHLAVWLFSGCSIYLIAVLVL